MGGLRGGVGPSPAAAQPRIATQQRLPRCQAVVAASADDDRRLSRRAFVLGLGTAVGTAAVLGFGALLRSDATSAGVQLADAQSGNGWQGDGSTPSDGGGSTGSTDGSGQRVVVDSAACVGCGRCLDVCPYGVFAWSGGTAVAQNPDACRLCGHCVQVCPAAAITLNG
jgi:NAD-dependent dihydropyrimidine dehydrogenase PreA subunit